MRPNTNKQSYNFRCEYAERKSLQQVSDTFDAIVTRLKEKLWYRSIRGKIFENGVDLYTIIFFINLTAKKTVSFIKKETSHMLPEDTNSFINRNNDWERGKLMMLSTSVDNLFH